MNKPLVSVIIPVYNLEAYLGETLESVTAQTIGFEQNIELIIIDDGSSDKSSEVYHKYKNKFPNNVYIKAQKNKGVSAARNLGFRKSRGQYIHFLDGDDILSKNYYKESIHFLSKHKDVPFVASKIKFFDEIINSHPLNYKFHSNRIIDLKTEPDAPLLHVVTVIFRRDAIENIHFDEKLSIAEDAKFISDTLLKSRIYGVLKSPTYYYRKRSSGGSAIGGKELNKSYYLETPALVYEHIYETWSKINYTLPIEYTILYDLSYRLDQTQQPVLTENESRQYVKSIQTLAQKMSDEAVLASRFLSVYKKIYILQLKYKEHFTKHLTMKNSSVYFHSVQLYDFSKSAVHLDFLTHEKGEVYAIEGYIDAPINIATVKYFIVTGDHRRAINFTARSQLEKNFLGDTYKHSFAFSSKLRFPINSQLSVVIQYQGREQPLYLDTGPFTRFGALKLTYRNDYDSLLKRASHSIYRYGYTKIKHVQLEARMLLQIIFNWRLRSAYTQLQKLLARNIAQLSVRSKIFEILKPIFIIGESVLMIPRALILRTFYYLALHRKRKPIWIISDRGMAAGDNGEALFRYIMSQRSCPADVYFVISKKSKDYHRIKSIGPVLSQSSLRYKLKFLLADKIISSQADVEVTNPFIRQGDHYVDLFTFDFIFLQHGIIRHNLSTWLNRYNKNIRLFITSAEKEYNSIFSNPYYYSKENVLLSGMPRYDYLNNNPKRKLILAPTYRKNLAKQKTDKNGARRYDPTFKYSEYREFYNNFMNDSRLREALRKAKMKGEFYLHPAFSSQIQDFDENDEFSVMKFPYDYKKAFSEGEMLVSDHSSVVFDFAYLKKPVAYAHFDVKTFFAGHSYDESNFFSDEDDGFGNVYYDYETLVEGAVKIIKEGTTMPDKYKKRVDDFFYKVDKNNSKRVYDAIVKDV